MPLLDLGRQEINLTEGTLHFILGFLPFLALVHPIYIVLGKVSPYLRFSASTHPRILKTLGEHWVGVNL